MNAMIFAAGLGTRLRPLTNDRPKALVEVAGKPLLEHNILKLKTAGFDHIVVNVHHFGEQIIQFLEANNNFGIDIKVSDERQHLLDTGGGIKHAIPLFTEPGPILIHNVDIISNIDLKLLFLQHLNDTLSIQEKSIGATLAINDRKTSRYLMFGRKKNLCGWTNITTGETKGEMGEKYAFAGIHVISPMLFQYLQSKKEEAFPIINFYLDVCKDITFIGDDVTKYEWVDCGKPESLVEAANILKVKQ